LLKGSVGFDGVKKKWVFGQTGEGRPRVGKMMTFKTTPIKDSVNSGVDGGGRVEKNRNRILKGSTGRGRDQRAKPASLIR